MNIEERFMKVILPIINNENNISLDNEFKYININSIIYIKLIVAIEKEFKFEFDEEMLVCKSNFCLRDILNYIEKKCRNKG